MASVTRFRLRHSDPSYPNPISGQVEQYDPESPLPPVLTTISPPGLATDALAAPTPPATTSVELRLGTLPPIGTWGLGGGAISVVDVSVTSMGATAAHGWVVLSPGSVRFNF